jgi:hypothetical protein
MTDEELAALRELYEATLIEAARLNDEAIALRIRVEIEEDRRARGNVRDFRPRPSGDGGE